MMASANAAMGRMTENVQMSLSSRYSKENHLDFGDVPDFLPALHPAEEMVIARVHVSVNFFP